MKDLLAIFAIGVLALSVNAADICKTSPDGYAYPDPRHCSNFMLCVNQIGEERKCSFGLHFSPTKFYCQRPEIAGCKINNELPDCSNSNDGVTFPKPYDCGKFYICNEKKAVEKNCNAGLHYNARKGYCELPELADCEWNSTPPTPTNPPKPTDGTPPTTDVCKGKPLGYLTPYPGDCTKFITCIGGGVVKSCPPPLHFSDKKKVCDWPESANCPWQ